jgi:hypothetical protein
MVCVLLVVLAALTLPAKALAAAPESGPSGESAAGYAALQSEALTAQTATAEADAYLSRTYGPAYTASARKWLKCPEEEIFSLEEGQPPLALCKFEFRNGGRYRGGGFNVKSAGTAFAIENFSSWLYTKALRSCGSLPSERVNGVRVYKRRVAASPAAHSCRDTPLMMGDIDYDATKRFPRALRSGYKTPFTAQIRPDSRSGLSSRAASAPACAAPSARRGRVALTSWVTDTCTASRWIATPAAGTAHRRRLIPPALGATRTTRDPACPSAETWTAGISASATSGS